MSDEEVSVEDSEYTTEETSEEENSEHSSDTSEGEDENIVLPPPIFAEDSDEEEDILSEEESSNVKQVAKKKMTVKRISSSLKSHPTKNKKAASKKIASKKAPAPKNVKKKRVESSSEEEESTSEHSSDTTEDESEEEESTSEHSSDTTEDESEEEPSETRVKSSSSKSQSDARKKSSSVNKPVDLNKIRDSTIDGFLDPRKLRRTPLPDFEEDVRQSSSSVKSLTKQDSPHSLRNSTVKNKSAPSSTRTSLVIARSSPKTRTSTSAIPPEEIPDLSIPPERMFVSSKSPSKNTSIKNPSPPKEENTADEEDTSDPQDTVEEQEDDEKSEGDVSVDETEVETVDEKDNGEKKKKKRDKTLADDYREKLKEEELKEKKELIYEFWLMEKNGIPVRKKYEITDNIDDMRFEYHRLKSEGEIKDKVKLGWNVFSSIQSFGEMITAKWQPFGISLEGWSEDVESQKSEYEKVFRKIYKNMASRFYVRPGLQLMVMFGTQFLLFIAPRILNKFKLSNEESESSTKSITSDGTKKIVLDNIKASDDAKFLAMQNHIIQLRNQFAEQLQKMQQQQMLLIDSQQKLFDQMAKFLERQQYTNHNQDRVIEEIIETKKDSYGDAGVPYRTSTESNTQPPEPIQNTVSDVKDVGKKNTDDEKLSEYDPKTIESDSEYEYVEVEVTDDEAEQNQKPNIASMQKVTKEDEKGVSSIGEVLTSLAPVVNIIRQIKTKDKGPGLNETLYNDPPEIPDSMKEQHQRLQEKGIFEKDQVVSTSEQKTITSEPSDENSKPDTTPKETSKSSKRTATWNLDS